jgi:hypothetical protein
MRPADVLGDEGLIEDDPLTDASRPVADITRTPTEYPMGRDARLQTLARGDEGFLLGARLFDPARLCAQPSLRGRNPHRRGRCRGDDPRTRLHGRDRARSSSPNARWSTSSRDRLKVSRRNSPAATASCSASPSARRWRCRWSTGRCGQANWARIPRRAGPGRGIRADRMATTCRRPASSSISSCRTTSISRPNSEMVRACAATFCQCRKGRGRASATAGGRGMTEKMGFAEPCDLQLRLSRRADQADDPPRDPQGDRHPRLSGALRQPRDADALWLGHRRRAGDGRDHRRPTTR